MCEDGRVFGKSFMARPDEPTQQPAPPGPTQELMPVDFEFGPVYLALHIEDWKDIVGEIDWLSSSPAERLLQKRAADRTLHLDDNGFVAADVVPFYAWDLRSSSLPAIRQERADRRRRRVDRVKRGLVVPQSRTVKGESAEERVP